MAGALRHWRQRLCLGLRLWSALVLVALLACLLLPHLAVVLGRS